MSAMDYSGKEQVLLDSADARGVEVIEDALHPLPDLERTGGKRGIAVLCICGGEATGRD